MIFLIKNVQNNRESIQTNRVFVKSNRVFYQTCENQLSKIFMKIECPWESFLLEFN